MLNETDKQPLVSIIIINYNGQKFLQSCINTVRNSEYSNFEIILVDNGSTDRSVQLINKFVRDDSRLKLIAIGKNLGPAEGRNVGSMIAKGKYLAYLDNDTEVDPLWLKDPIGLMENTPTIGAIQCKLLLMNERNKFDYAGDYLSQYGFLIQRASFREIDDGQLDQVIDIFAAKSAGMIVNRNVYEQIGRFDKDYFIYMEETDLCWRIWLNGYRVIFMPTSIVYHSFGNTQKVSQLYTKYLSKYHGTKNYISTLIKNLEPISIIKILPVHSILWFGIIYWYMSRRRMLEASWILRGMLWNLIGFKTLWKKHLDVKYRVRKLPDNYIMQRIMRQTNLSYFYKKFSNSP